MSPILSLISLSLLAMSNLAAATNGPSTVNLRTAGNYTIIGQAGITNVPPSVITGDMGVSPIAGTAITGFALTLDSSGTFSTSPQVAGSIYAASYLLPTPARLIVAVLDVGTAYTDASGRPNPTAVESHAGIIGGVNFTPGIYKWSSVVTAASDITLTGGATDTWIFQIAGTFSLGTAARVVLTGGALPKNIFWAVAGAVDLQAGSHFEGILLAATSVTLITGATMNGRIFAQTAVALQMATVTAPAGSGSIPNPPACPCSCPIPVQSVQSIIHGEL